VAGKGSGGLRKCIWGLDLVYWGYSFPKWNEPSLEGSELAVSRAELLVLHQTYWAYGLHEVIVSKTLFYIFHHYYISKKICLPLSHGYMHTLRGPFGLDVSLPGIYYVYTTAYLIVYPFNVHLSPLNTPALSHLSLYSK